MSIKQIKGELLKNLFYYKNKSTLYFDNYKKLIIMLKLKTKLHWISHTHIHPLKSIRLNYQDRVLC